MDAALQAAHLHKRMRSCKHRQISTSAYGTVLPDPHTFFLHRCRLRHHGILYFRRLDFLHTQAVPAWRHGVILPPWPVPAHPIPFQKHSRIPRISSRHYNFLRSLQIPPSNSLSDRVPHSLIQQDKIPDVLSIFHSDNEG